MERTMNNVKYFYLKIPYRYLIARKAVVYIGLIILCGILFTGHPSVSAQGKNSFEADSKIDRVMVFQDRALVTRSARLGKIPSGTSEIVFSNLPMLIQDDSVRAKITEGGDAKILDVEVRTVLLEKAPELKIRQFQEKLQKQLDDRKRLQNKIKVLQYELEYLNDARKHFLEVDNTKSGNSEKATPETRSRNKHRLDEYESMLRYLNEKYTANISAQMKEEIEIRELDTQIGLTKSELSKTSAGQSNSPNKKIAKVTINAAKAGSYLLELSYINFKTKWKPGYDMRVFVDDKKTEFTGYGVVDQNSGEDWTDALISYSTAQPSVGGYLPELMPLYATISSKLAGGDAMSTGNIAAQNAANRDMLAGLTSESSIDSGSGEGVENETESDTRTERKAGSIVFHVPRRSDIPSDGSPHRTAISRHSIPVRFEYSSVPRLSPHAYLQAIGNNNMKLPILRGDLNIFMGNDFVGSSNTDNIMPGEDFELTLTADDNIRVTRVLDEKGEKKGGFLSSSQQTAFSFIIKVENYSGKEIVMNLIDQIPVSETDEIEITNVAFSQKPAKQGKNGIVKWQFPVKSRETVQITFSFTVNIPKGKELAFFRTGMSPAQYLQNIQNQRKERSRNVQQKEDAFDIQQEYKAPAMKKR
jgi:uncharacterized protein (TIGR02231 family)